MPKHTHSDAPSKLLEGLNRIWRAGLLRYSPARPLILATFSDALTASRIGVLRWEGAALLLEARIYGDVLEDFLADELVSPAVFDISLADARRLSQADQAPAWVSLLTFDGVHTRLGLTHPLDRITREGGLPLFEYLTRREEVAGPIGRVDVRPDSGGLRIYGPSGADSESPVILDDGLDEDRLPSSFRELAEWCGVIEAPSTGPEIGAVLLPLLARVYHWGGLVTFHRDGWSSEEVITRLTSDRL